MEPTVRTDTRRPAPRVDDARERDLDSTAAWKERSRIVLSPIAAPSILGLFGFAGATFMVASNLAGWWGDTMTSPIYLAPFALVFGGLAQFLAGMWSYRARDAVATAAHGTWGAFWLAYGLFFLLIAADVLPASAAQSQAFGFWFIVLTVVTLFCAIGALGANLSLFTVLALLTAGSGLLAAGLVGSIHSLVIAAGWVLVASAGAAFYTAGAMLLEGSFGGRVILPLGRWSGAENVPLHKVSDPISYEQGMPGVKVGQ